MDRWNVDTQLAASDTSQGLIHHSSHHLAIEQQNFERLFHDLPLFISMDLVLSGIIAIRSN